jgi:hypothetical protein
MEYIRFILVLALVTLLPFTSSQAAGPRTRGVQITSKSQLTLDKLYGQSHAVIIGINAYTKFPSVDYAVKDARAIQQIFLSKGFQTNVLLDQQATKEGILKILGDELPRRVQQNDRVIIFFAGHTQTEEKADGTQMGYLVPADADSSNVWPTSISIDQVREISGRIRANHVIFLIDSCFSGLGLTASETIPPGDRNYLQKISARKAHQVLTAGDKGQTARSREDGLGIFTAYIMEGLSGAADRDGKGFVTSNDLASYVKLQVSRLSATKQVPQFGNIAGKGEVIVASTGSPTILKADMPASGQDTRTTGIPSPQKADVSVSDQSSPRTIEPLPLKADSAPAVEKDTPKLIEEKRLPETDGLSLAAKQAQMEELKRLDSERRRTQEVVLKQSSSVPASEAGRFIAYDNGTVLDTKTNLMWAAKDNGSNINWQGAKNYCENYRGGGYTDWRMPTQDELSSLYDASATNTNPPAVGCKGGYHVTNLIHLTCCCPWTSETRGSTAAYVGFSNGPRDWVDQFYTGGIRVLPVRSSK